MKYKLSIIQTTKLIRTDIENGCILRAIVTGFRPAAFRQRGEYTNPVFPSIDWLKPV